VLVKVVPERLALGRGEHVGAYDLPVPLAEKKGDERKTFMSECLKADKKS
jgi:hypothetical protein